MKKLQALLARPDTGSIETKPPAFIDLPAILYLDNKNEYKSDDEVCNVRWDRGFFLDMDTVGFPGTLILSANEHHGFSLQLHASRQFMPDFTNHVTFFGDTPFFELETRIETILGSYTPNFGYKLREFCQFSFKTRQALALPSHDAECAKFALRLIRQLEGTWIVLKLGAPQSPRSFKEYWERDIFPHGRYL